MESLITAGTRFCQENFQDYVIDFLNLEIAGTKTPWVTRPKPVYLVSYHRLMQKAALSKHVRH